jgi:ankyrin repeat protein
MVYASKGARVYGNTINFVSKNSLYGEQRWGGSTPLHFAAWQNHDDLAELLLTKAADVNAKNAGGRTPLHWASWNGNRKMAELLLARGADVNAKNKNGTTPLFQAISKGHTEVADLLRKHGGVKSPWF